MRTEEHFVVFKRTDTISCCGRDLSFSDFVTKDGDVYNIGSSIMKTFYHHCPNCNAVLVYDRGHGELQKVKGEVFSDD